MTLHQLRIFAAISRHLNITKAAKELHISQPSVFKQAKTLEQSCGIKLYRKIGRGIELTREGRLFEADTREILAKIESLTQRFNFSSESSIGGSLTIAGSHAPSVSVLPSLLAAFKKTHPQVQVNLQTTTSHEAEQLLQSAVVEIAVVTHPSVSNEFHHLTIRREPIVAFVSSRHPFAKKAHPSVNDIARVPLVVHRGLSGKTGAATRAILERIEALGQRPNILMECNSAEAVKTAVLKGLGIGVLMKAHLDREIRSRELRVLRVAGLENIANLSLVCYRKDKPLGANAREFLELLQRSQPHRGDSLN